MKIAKYIAVVAVALASMTLVSATIATTLTIGDSRDLGLISKNQPADPVSSTSFLNILLGQALGSTATIGANTYTRTMSDPLAGVYPAAVFATQFGAVTTIDLAGGYLYLLAKYDGPNWGSQIWYVGGLTGTITIPQFGNGEQYGISHVYLFNPNGETVPEGGMSLVLLGTAAGALFFVRRFAVA